MSGVLPPLRHMTLIVFTGTALNFMIWKADKRLVLCCAKLVVTLMYEFLYFNLAVVTEKKH
jgi:hypothetical protein